MDKLNLWFNDFGVIYSFLSSSIWDKNWLDCWFDCVMVNVFHSLMHLSMYLLEKLQQKRKLKFIRLFYPDNCKKITFFSIKSKLFSFIANKNLICICASSYRKRKKLIYFVWSHAHPIFILSLYDSFGHLFCVLPMFLFQQTQKSFIMKSSSPISHEKKNYFPQHWYNHLLIRAVLQKISYILEI